MGEDNFLFRATRRSREEACKNRRGPKKNQCRGRSNEE
jgi:hypothetical protein